MNYYRKKVDKSLLREGFSIPAKYEKEFFEMCGIILHHGERKNIKIKIDGEVYDADIVNQGFNLEDYPNHTDVLQIRYRKYDNLSSKLCEEFKVSKTYIDRQGYTGNKRVTKVPKEIEEAIIIIRSQEVDSHLEFIIEKSKISLDQYDLIRT